jgi:hypothetical protein
MAMSDGLLVALVGSLSAVVTTILTLGISWRKWESGERKKILADAAGTIAEAAAELVRPLREEIQSLRIDNTRIREEILLLQKELKEWQDWAKRLEEQIRGLGYEPIQRNGKRKG